MNINQICECGLDINKQQIIIDQILYPNFLKSMIHRIEHHRKTLRYSWINMDMLLLDESIDKHYTRYKDNLKNIILENYNDIVTRQLLIENIRDHLSDMANYSGMIYERLIINE